jgi:hypothetical protein
VQCIKEVKKDDKSPSWQRTDRNTGHIKDARLTLEKSLKKTVNNTRRKIIQDENQVQGKR